MFHLDEEIARLVAMRRRVTPEDSDYLMLNMWSGVAIV